VESSLWKRLWTCRKTDYEMNEWMCTRVRSSCEFLTNCVALCWLNLASPALYYTILYYSILYYTVLYYTVLYYTFLYYTITILYCTVLYFTILYYNILEYCVCNTLSYTYVRLLVHTYASVRLLKISGAKQN